MLTYIMLPDKAVYIKFSHFDNKKRIEGLNTKSYYTLGTALQFYV